MKSNTRTNLRVKLISLILTLVMLFFTLPVGAIALGETVASESMVATEGKSSGESGDVTVIGEDISKRTESTKEYFLSDGTRMVASYAQPVHYEENGEWFEIDHRLIYDSTSETFASENGRMRFLFSKNADEESLVRIQNGHYRASHRKPMFCTDQQ